MTRQQCKTCQEWFEDDELDAHLVNHLQDDKREKGEDRPLICPLCQGTDFDGEIGNIQSASWLAERHRVIMMVCRQCGFIMQFHEGRTLWNLGLHPLSEKETNPEKIPGKNE